MFGAGRYAASHVFDRTIFPKYGMNIDMLSQIIRGAMEYYRNVTLSG
jgi:uncharacterized protein YozE (UPF0346 family)